MAASGFLLISSFLVILMLLAKPIGSLLARLIEGEPLPGVTGFERGLWRLSGIQNSEMDWKSYLTAILLFNVLGIRRAFQYPDRSGDPALQPTTVTGVILGSGNEHCG